MRIERRVIASGVERSEGINDAIQQPRRTITIDAGIEFLPLWQPLDFCQPLFEHFLAS